MDNNIGVYKITSPSGKIYIGSSLNLKTRFRVYKRLDCKSQTRLYNSFIKYGVENHLIEVVEFCDKEEVRNREAFWGDRYEVLGPKGLNCKLPKFGKYGGMSQETKNKIGLSNKGKVKPKEVREKLSNIMTGTKRKPHSRETKLKMSLSHKGKKVLESTRVKMRNRVHSEETKRKIKERHSKLILDTSNGVYYYSFLEAVEHSRYSKRHLSRMLTGKYKNKTSLIYV